MRGPRRGLTATGLLLFAAIAATVAQEGFLELPVTFAHAELAGSLPEPLRATKARSMGSSSAHCCCEDGCDSWSTMILCGVGGRGGRA